MAPAQPPARPDRPAPKKLRPVVSSAKPSRPAGVPGDPGSSSRPSSQPGPSLLPGASTQPGVPARSGAARPKPTKRTVTTWTFQEGKEPLVSFFSARPWKRQRRPPVRQSRSLGMFEGRTVSAAAAAAGGASLAPSPGAQYCAGCGGLRLTGSHDQSKFHQVHAPPPPSSSAPCKAAPEAPPGPLQPGPAATSVPAAPPALFPAPVVAAPLPAAPQGPSCYFGPGVGRTGREGRPAEPDELGGGGPCDRPVLHHGHHGGGPEDDIQGGRGGVVRRGRTSAPGPLRNPRSGRGGNAGIHGGGRRRHFQFERRQ
ncbi:uncharacterized protein LOC144165882 [Haemaphysalis longicornis]